MSELIRNRGSGVLSRATFEYSQKNKDAKKKKYSPDSPRIRPWIAREADPGFEDDEYQKLISADEDTDDVNTLIGSSASQWNSFKDGLSTSGWVSHTNRKRLNAGEVKNADAQRLQTILPTDIKDLRDDSSALKNPATDKGDDIPVNLKTPAINPDQIEQRIDESNERYQLEAQRFLPGGVAGTSKNGAAPPEAKIQYSAGSGPEQRQRSAREKPYIPLIERPIHKQPPEVLRASQNYADIERKHTQENPQPGRKLLQTQPEEDNSIYDSIVKPALKAGAVPATKYLINLGEAAAGVPQGTIPDSVGEAIGVTAAYYIPDGPKKAAKIDKQIFPHGGNEIEPKFIANLESKIGRKLTLEQKVELAGAMHRAIEAFKNAEEKAKKEYEDAIDERDSKIEQNRMKYKRPPTLPHNVHPQHVLGNSIIDANKEDPAPDHVGMRNDQLEKPAEIRRVKQENQGKVLTLESGFHESGEQSEAIKGVQQNNKYSYDLDDDDLDDQALDSLLQTIKKRRKMRRGE